MLDPIHTTMAAAQHTTASAAISITCLVLVVLLSVPSIRQSVSRLRAKKVHFQALADRYEDEDGVATEESEEAYSDFVPRLILVLLSAVASLDALAAAVLITSRPQFSLAFEQWLQFVTWVSLLPMPVGGRCLTPASC
jgi:hypothetical protein